MSENEISKVVIGCAIEVHRGLGPGLLESVYERTLAFELESNGLFVQRQVPVPIVYKGVNLEMGFRMDLLVERRVPVEIKSVEAINAVFEAQTLTQLKLSNLRLALLINFNAVALRSGIRRFVNNL